MIRGNINRFFWLLFDSIAAIISVLISELVTGNLLNAKIESILVKAFCFLLPFILFMYIFKVYHIIWCYARSIDCIRIFASSLSGVLISSLAYKIAFPSEKVDFLSLIILLTLSVFFSLIIRYIFRDEKKQESKDKTFVSGNVMVIGGGAAGSMIINDIQNNIEISDKNKCFIKCVIDDNPSKLHQYVSGVKVVGATKDIIEIAKNKKIDTIIFAIPSCPNDKKTAILNMCQKTGCEIKVIPSLYQLISNKNEEGINVNASLLRKVQIEDLLGREPTNINVEEIMGYVSNKVVLVTGGGGSIGSELCRQVASHKPKKLIIFDIYENNAYDIQNELIRDYPELDLVTLIGSVRDIDRLENVFAAHKPDIVYHAAAHKHVPLMEDSPNESIKNNVFGTANTAQCADKYGAEKFILISTDKAVNPTNIMGASKRICEMLVQTYNQKSKTEFVAVRFGNVLGSNGSVIPLFKSQIEKGGPVTVTHPNIIRYFMTIPEAVSLVLQAGATAKGGEIFVLDMGEPVKIIDLAEKLITLSGYTPYTDIKIEFTGLRPGEKLYEELLMSEEGMKNTNNSLIHIGKPIEIDEKLLDKTLDEMKNVIYTEKGDIRKLVKKIVPTYNYSQN